MALHVREQVVVSRVPTSIITVMPQPLRQEYRGLFVYHHWLKISCQYSIYRNRDLTVYNSTLEWEKLVVHALSYTLIIRRHCK